MPLSKEEFIQLRKQNRSVDEILQMGNKPAPTQPTPTTPEKSPNALSRVAGVASRVMEVPGALIGTTASNTMAFGNALKTGDWAAFGQNLKKMGRELINIPGEVAQGATEGITKQSDIYSLSNAFGMQKNEPLGIALDIAGDLVTPGGAIKQGSKLGMNLFGKAGGTLSNIGKQIGGVPKPVIPFKPELGELPQKVTKASDAINSEIQRMSQVVFPQTAKEAKMGIKNLGKKLGDRVQTEVQDLNQIAQKYGVPTTNWNDAKIYIESARKAAGDLVTKVSQKAEKINFSEFRNSVNNGVKQIEMAYGEKEAAKAKALVDNWIKQIDSGTLNSGYKLRDALDTALTAKNKMGMTGQAVFNITDQLIDTASKSLRNTLNKYEPLRQAQEAYSELDMLSRKATEVMANNAAKAEKLKQKLPQVVKEEEQRYMEGIKKVKDALAKKEKEWEQNRQIIMQRYENQLNAFTPQKFIGRVISGKAMGGKVGIPQTIGGLPGVVNRLGQMFQSENQSK